MKHGSLVLYLNNPNKKFEYYYLAVIATVLLRTSALLDSFASSASGGTSAELRSARSLTLSTHLTQSSFEIRYERDARLGTVQVSQLIITSHPGVASAISHPAGNSFRCSLDII
jgi:hypothetical protein